MSCNKTYHIEEVDYAVWKKYCMYNINVKSVPSTCQVGLGHCRIKKYWYYTMVQWNPSLTITIGTQYFVLHVDDVGMAWKRCGIIDSHLVWLVFEASIPTCTFFSFRKLFVTCFCCFFVMSFRSGKREERWDGRPRGRCMVKFFVHIKLKNHHKLKYLQVKL